MKTGGYERDPVLERLPGLSSCGDAHDPAAASFALLSFNRFIRSFPLVGFLLSLLCLYTWMSLVYFLLRSMGGSSMIFKNRSFTSKHHRAGKSSRSSRKVREGHKKAKMQKESACPPPKRRVLCFHMVSLIVGREQRMFVAHEDVLSRSPFFNVVLKDQFVGDNPERVLGLPEEEPELLSCILEFLYKGDYYPRLIHNKAQDAWELEDAKQDFSIPDGSRSSSSEATFFHPGTGGLILRDTAVYCAAEKYGLGELKHLALRKQGLQSGIPIDVILRSARYVYDNTPDSEYRLRAHYLAMIIRTRDIFKDSGTMQFEMEMGHPIFFDLFVAMCNHLDDLEEMSMNH
ncbi:hypothetical protein BO78DRAFT_422742 [Aspergillus sclerotiicarbonarius CBS 121057]|uniref:BTB domain-containing protein n=1 Tax=Aspergillus sclerotiicarbonarius (strain CBS 121057 / IBT 28362) TaxID=1448318 RepID=A0A319EEM8_ASPSB|nr:hypothetical protein BO78DRAFT_422742 [Aspergillus sclerotiicarbonarius CBS 121057]